MKYSWDLKKIYSKKEDFYYDMTLIRDKLKKLCEYKEMKIDGNTLYELMNKCFEIREINFKTLLYASLSYYTDINNEYFVKMKEQAESLDNIVNNETNFIDELINIIEYDNLNLFYEQCDQLKDYKFYIDNVKRLGKHICNNIDLVNLNKENINNCLLNYNNLIKNMNFGNINDISLNNSNISKYLIDENRDIRKKSFDNVNKIYISKGLEFFNIFKELVDSKKNIANIKNYSSVLESELSLENINSSLITNLINSVNDNIFLMNKYLKLKCNYLKLDNLNLYDMNINIVNNNKDVYSLDNAIKIIKESLSVLGEKYIESIDYLINNNHLDLECNEKKHPTIIFSWNTYSFINYKDRYIDLKNLAHELGHIINCYYSIKNQPYIYNDSTVFIGEVVALVNEILLNDYLYNISEIKEQKIFYLTKIIENFISQVYRPTMYTEFENLIYNNNLDLEFLNNSYLSLVKKYYGDVVNIDSDIACEWMRVGHLFRWSYYVYKYAMGYILAFNVIKKLRDGALNTYIDFLSSGSSCSNEDMLKKLDIDLYSIDLFSDTFSLFNDYITKLENMLNS